MDICMVTVSMQRMGSILKVTHGHMHGHNVHAVDKTNALMGIMDLTKNSQ